MNLRYLNTLLTAWAVVGFSPSASVLHLTPGLCEKPRNMDVGTFTYIGDVAEVGEKMDALFLNLTRPVATHLNVDWPDGVDVWPARTPDLYAGNRC